MDVRGVGGTSPLGGVHPASAASPARPAQAATAAQSPKDELEVSPLAQQLDELSRSTTSPMRAARLAQIQAEIAAGTYETPDKLEAAVDRLLDDLQ